MIAVIIVVGVVIVVALIHVVALILQYLTARGVDFVLKFDTFDFKFDVVVHDVIVFFQLRFIKFGVRGLNLCVSESDGFRLFECDEVARRTVVVGIIVIREIDSQNV